MKYTFPYEFAGSIDIPDDQLLGVFQAHPANPLSEDEIITRAVQNPIGAPRLREIVKKNEKVLFLPSTINARIWQLKMKQYR